MGMQIRYGAASGPLAIAHRGGAGLAAENTLEAFERSYALGLRYLETDVRVTADGVPLAFHDATLRRVTGRPGAVSSRTYAEIRRLKVLGGHRIPTLTELFAAHPDACFTVDLKDERAIEPVAAVLRESGVAARVCVAGAWDGWLRALRTRVGPELTTALGWRDLAVLVACSHARVNYPGSLSGGFAHVPLTLGRLPIAGERLIERAHRLGIRVIVWTVDDPYRMHRLLDVGADGIITDRPDLLREVLIARGQWTAPSASLDPSATADPSATPGGSPTTSDLLS